MTVEARRRCRAKMEQMAKTECKPRPETLVQRALRSMEWGGDPILREWRRAHRQYRQALETREARKRLLRRSVMNRGLWWGRREQVRGGLRAWNRNADRYLPGDRIRPETILACECQTVPTCNRPPRKHRPNETEKAQRR